MMKKGFTEMIFSIILKSYKTPQVCSFYVLLVLLWNYLCECETESHWILKTCLKTQIVQQFNDFATLHVYNESEMMLVLGCTII